MEHLNSPWMVQNENFFISFVLLYPLLLFSLYFLWGIQLKFKALLYRVVAMGGASEHDGQLGVATSAACTHQHCIYATTFFWLCYDVLCYHRLWQQGMRVIEGQEGAEWEYGWGVVLQLHVLISYATSPSPAQGGATAGSRICGELDWTHSS